MKLITKQFVIIALIILAILSIIFGSYLPLIKSQKYISALRAGSQVTSVEQFKANFDNPIKFYSPIGDEEVIKFLTNDILQIITQEKQSEPVSRILAEYTEPYLFQNNVRHMIVGAEYYLVLWQKSGKEEDYQKSEEYFKKARDIGPKLPPVLYGMLNLYQIRGDAQKVQEIKEVILKYWPEDEGIKQLQSQIPAQL